MLDKILKKYFKDRVFVYDSCNMVISYRVNVNCKVGKHYDGGEYRSIDLNIKVVGSNWIMGGGDLLPMFGERKADRLTYIKVKDYIRWDLNNRLNPTFPIYLFGGGVYKGVGRKDRIRINRYTYC